MLTIPGNKGNANQNQLRVHLTPHRTAIIKNITNNTNVGEAVGKKEASYTAGGNVS
jgi:hypothetical protein